MQAAQNQPIYSEAPLQLLLFVDGRPKSRQQIQRIRDYLNELGNEYRFELQIIDVKQQPYLAEHFKLVATPSLVKIHPEPQQIIAGSNIIGELKTCWPRWRNSIESFLGLQLDPLAPVDQHEDSNPSKTTINSIASSIELIKLEDRIFHLQQEKEILQEQLQFKERVISMLVHDLRNPLTAIGIAVETLQSNFHPDTGKFQKITPKIVTNLFKHARCQTRIIDRMITDLLELGQGQETTIPITPQKLALRQLCLEVSLGLSDRHKAKLQTIQTDIPQDLPYVYADPERIRQVLINLLDNAIKYTPIGGRISLAGLHRTTQKVQFSVSDTGPGIPPENRDQIFEDHFRLQRDEATEGYGIGLNLCQRIIRSHYGQIWVESNSHGGACFHFTLPVYPF